MTTLTECMSKKARVDLGLDSEKVECCPGYWLFTHKHHMGQV